LAGAIREVGLGESGDVTARGLGPKRHGAVEPHPDLRLSLAHEVLAEIRRHLDRQLQLAAPQTQLDFVGRCDRRPLVEITRALKTFDELAALRRPVLIEHREGQVLHVEGDAVAEGQQQEQRPEKGERQPGRIANDLERLAPRAGEQPARIGLSGGGGRRSAGNARQWLARAASHARLLEHGDEHLLQRVFAARLLQLGRRADGQHLAVMHERDAVATLRLVHEVGG
jgi:hypothetical protein